MYRTCAHQKRPGETTQPYPWGKAVPDHGSHPMSCLPDLRGCNWPLSGGRALQSDDLFARRIVFEKEIDEGVYLP